MLGRSTILDNTRVRTYCICSRCGCGKKTTVLVHCLLTCAIKPFQKGLSLPGRVAQSGGHLTRKSEVLGSIPDLATYFRFSFC